MGFSDTVKLGTLIHCRPALVQYLAHEALIGSNQCRKSMTVNIHTYKTKILSFLWCSFIWYNNNLMMQSNTIQINLTVYHYTVTTGNTGQYSFLFFMVSMWVQNEMCYHEIWLSLLILVWACLSLVFMGPLAGPPKALNFPLFPILWVALAWTQVKFRYLTTVCKNWIVAF